MSKSVIRCSVVILNWNGAEMLRRYLPSVLHHTPADCEVVVADNGSTDDSLTAIRDIEQSTGRTCRTLLLDHNYGFAEGYNRALDQIDTEYVVLLNSDVEVTAGWLDPMLHHLDEHPDVAAVQPKVLSWLSKQHAAKGETTCFEHAGAAGGYIDMLGYPFCRGRILSEVEQDHGQYDTVADIFWATGACMCARTHIYKVCGGLDASFFAHMEEIDLCWRMQCRGYRLCSVPDSTIYHLGGGALSYESPRKTYLNFRNNLLMIYKNLPTKHLIRVMPVRFALDYVALLQTLISGHPKNALAILQARRDYWRMRCSAPMRAARRENMQHAAVPYPATIARRSIILDYYLRGRKTFA